MKKKLLAMIIVAVLMLGGCGANQEVSTSQGQQEQTESSTMVHEKGESLTPEDLLAGLEIESESESVVLETKEYNGEYWEVVWKVKLETEEQLENIFQDAILYNYNIAIAISQEQIEVYIKQNGDEIDAIDEICLGNADIKDGTNTWNIMLITGLDIQKYEEILEQIKKNSEKFYQLIRIQEYGESFAVWIEPVDYCVMEGETLTEIALKKQTTVENLMALNPEISDFNNLELYYHLRIR